MRDEGFQVVFHKLTRKPSGLAKHYGVRRNPTYIYVAGGKEVRRATGSQSVVSLKMLMRKSMF